MPFLERRVLAHELMDSPGLPAREVDAALVGLARLNRVSGAAAIVWRHLRPLLREGTSNTLLDIATGGADVPVAVARRARASGVELGLSLCDLRPEMRAVAERACGAAGVRAETFAFDALKDEIPGRYDIVLTSLFTHHLKDEEVVALLRAMKGAAVRGVIVSDLERGALNLGLSWAGARLVTRSRVVHVDAPLSVRAAFTAHEFAALAERAGLSGGVVHRAFPCRFVYVWRAQQ